MFTLVMLCLQDWKVSVFWSQSKPLSVLVALQVIVPICLLSYQMRHFTLGADYEAWEFRTGGFILLLYSVWNIYDNSVDECRTLYMKVANHLNLGARFTWIAVAGDVINTFCGFVLVITLFSVFCFSVDPFNLVINCIAINYVGNVDNEFTGDALQRHTCRLIESLLNQEDRLKAKRSESSHALLKYFVLFLAFTRTAGTLVCGHVLAFVFLFNHSYASHRIANIFGLDAVEVN